MKKKILIVVANYYENIARSLLKSAKNKIKNKCNTKVINVPGAFEIPVTISKNLNKFNGLVMSQRVLLALTQKGLSREKSYELVQRNAMKVWEKNKDFMTELLLDQEILNLLSKEEIQEKFNLKYHTKHVDTIFERVFG